MGKVSKQISRLFAMAIVILTSPVWAVLVVVTIVHLLWADPESILGGGE